MPTQTFEADKEFRQFCEAGNHEVFFYIDDIKITRNSLKTMQDKKDIALKNISYLEHYLYLDKELPLKALLGAEKSCSTQKERRAFYSDFLKKEKYKMITIKRLLQIHEQHKDIICRCDNVETLKEQLKEAEVDRLMELTSPFYKISLECFKSEVIKEEERLEKIAERKESHRKGRIESYITLVIATGLFAWFMISVYLAFNSRDEWCETYKFNNPFATDADCAAQRKMHDRLGQ